MIFLEIAKTLNFNEDEYLKLELSILDPKNYISKYKVELSERGIRKPFKDLALIAFVDILIEKKIAWEIDWKENPNEINEILKLLIINNQIEINETKFLMESLNKNTNDYLFDMSEKLKKHNVNLLNIDIVSDSIVLVILNNKKFLSISEKSRKIFREFKIEC